MIISTLGPQNAGQIHMYFDCGDLFLSPEEYQRENAWNLSQKQLLIDTIFRGMDIPKFYLWKIDQNTLANGYPDGEMKQHYKDILEHKRKDNDEGDPHVYEVVDGQQRIRTILEYMGAKPKDTLCYRGHWHEPFPALTDTPMAKGKHYAQLNAEQKLTFQQKPLTIVVLQNATIDEIRDMFLRLQNGTPLNAQQKRDASGSSVGRVARELTELPFFKQSVGFSDTASSHRLVASQMLHLEQKDKIVSCTSAQLDGFYRRYIQGVQLEPSVVVRTKKILVLLGKVFPTKNPHLNQNYALSLYWALSRILQTYDIPEDQFTIVRENFEKLDLARLEAQERDYRDKPDDEIYSELSLAMSRGNTGLEGISIRHRIVCQYLFEGVTLKEYPNLDTKRNFTEEEKLILYHRAKGCCQLSINGKECGRPLSFDDPVIDHILPHSREGRTSLENGRVAFKSCNIARGVREDFDPGKNCHLLPTPNGETESSQ
ncbi:MAG: HNH endonuclease family protein [Nitrospirales bacterium]